MLKDQIIVPISIVFKKNLEIDFKNTKRHILFLIKKKVKVFYLAQSASELERMSQEERFKVAKFVTKIVNNRAKLIFQPLAYTHINDQIKEAKKLISLGCHALVIKPLKEKYILATMKIESQFMKKRKLSLKNCPSLLS